MPNKKGEILEKETTLYAETSYEHDQSSHIESKDSVSLWRHLLLIFEKASRKLDSLGVESNGIERIPPYERGTFKKQLIHVVGLWVSATGGLSSMSTFLLGPLLFNLTFHQSLLSGLLGMTVGCFVAAYCSTMGPQSGCRQMVTARYLFGWWFVKFVALAAIVGVMGWSVVNSVVGGEMLASISNDKVPLWVGIVIVTAVSFLVATFGIKQVLKVETWFSIPVITVFMLLYISSSDKFYMIGDFDNKNIAPLTIKGNWMTFFSLCYSVTATWGSITADYYILFPETTPERYVFTITFCGIFLPTLFVSVLGITLSSVAATYKPWNDMYSNYGMGGLLHSGFERWHGFGKFCVVVLILSLISNNIVNTYSAAFSIQLSSIKCAKIPRWIWSIVCTAVYLICALVGRNHFSTILSNFLPMIGYWISMYFIILLEENLIFRTFYHHLYKKEFPTSTARLNEWQAKHYTKHKYNWDKWDDPETLTRGIAATAAFLCGIAGVVVGMAQTYWIGPIAAHFGEFGGDIAMWLSMAFAGVTYPPLRLWELCTQRR